MTLSNYLDGNPSYYIGNDGEAYCIEYGHDVTPVDKRYGCRYCSKDDNS
jgi:hypothetical protein